MATKQIEDCVGLIQAWMCKHQLKMNDEKTEFMVISSKHMSAPQSLAVRDHHIAPSLAASSLGVLVDSNAKMEAHINNICKWAYIQLRNIGKLKRYLSQDSLELVIHAFVTTKLDYCNSLLCGLQATLISLLQLVQNTAARILTGSPRHCHTTPLLRAHDWLPRSESSLKSFSSFTKLSMVMDQLIYKTSSPHMYQLATYALLINL